MKYEITPNFIYIDVPKDVGEMLDAVWNERRSMYRLPNTIGALREVYRFVSPRERGPYVSYANKKVWIRNEFVRIKNLKDAPGDERLRPYQRVDVNYLKKIPHAGIFNQMRTGKTPTSLKVVEDLENIIIVCPAGLVLQWKEEVEKWTQKQCMITAIGTKKKRLTCYETFTCNSGVLIISYETLRNDLAELSPMLRNLTKATGYALIVDEAHRLRSLCGWRTASKQSKTVFELGRHAKKRLALTGTPTVRSGDEIFGILTFLYPDRFPGYWQFVDRYFIKKPGHFGGFEIKGYKRQEELEEILTLISTNRKRKDVMKWLPPKQYQTIHLELEKKQKKAYEDMAEIFEVEQDGEILVDAPSVLAQLTRLRQITTGPDVLGIDGTGAKEKFLLEWLEDNPNESVLVLSCFTSFLKLLQPKIKNSLMIHGGVLKPQRKEIEKQFQAGKSKVLLANIQAVQEGLTLDKAETVIFLDKMYNPANNEQAQDRIVPVSKERNHSMSVISLVCKDTIDELVEYALKNKVDIIKVVNDAGINGLKRLMKEVQS